MIAPTPPPGYHPWYRYVLDALRLLWTAVYVGILVVVYAATSPLRDRRAKKR